MQIHRHIEKKIKTDYFFIEGTIDVDSDYFIDLIKKGFEEESNNNYKTNVGGKMTSWKYLNKNINFLRILNKLIHYLDSNVDLHGYELSEAWGFCLGPNEKTKYHGHAPHMWSGVLYLNECNTPLKFEKIDKSVMPAKGKFAIFSSFLRHGTDINETDQTKFGIAFNIRYTQDYT